MQISATSENNLPYHISAPSASEAVYIFIRDSRVLIRGVWHEKGHGEP